MFEKAKDLVLRDRGAARKALIADIKRDEAAGLEAELDALAEGARTEELERERDRADRAAEDERLRQVAETREGLAAAAGRFDASAAELGAAFDELEALQSKLAQLEPTARVDVNMRKWGYVRGLWFAAAPLCRRLGLARTMGSRPNAPLAERFNRKGTEG